MNRNYTDVRAVAQTKLSQALTEDNAALPAEKIREIVEETTKFLGVDNIDTNALIAELEVSFKTFIGSERELVGVDDGWTPWLPKRRAEIEWKFWDRYRQYLNQEKGWPEATLERLHQSTDKILGLMNNPEAPSAWDRRGMVVGHVQSGKTSNYTGLICKAADAGYKIIVVLAGFHKSLRSQTQIRLEEGFLGYDRGATLNMEDGRRVHVGVGNPLYYSASPTADSITTRADGGDFKKSLAKNFAINPGGNPLLFVVKKNASVLKNLLNWVKWAAQDKDEHGRSYVKDVPLLVIDDEADQGSIDTKRGAFYENGTPDPDHDPTTLNRRIRELLHTFNQSAYLGYTATPFANIFIHEEAKTDVQGEDLFPRSFIISLPTPSNYVGPAKLFGYEADEDETLPAVPIIREVTDHANSLDLDERFGWIPPKHNKSWIPRYNGLDEPPPSLREAIRSFVIVCAAREFRGDGAAHNSMLVHVTRFTNVQGRVAEQVRSELQDVQRRLRYGDGDSQDRILDEFKAIWENDFEQTHQEIKQIGVAPDCSTLDWADIEPLIQKAALSIEVREINGAAGEVLDYLNHESSGLNVIAIGGDKLSRGLTLEGLSVSYFLRASRMYDTLMQMGRWFGYRPRYLDLCRLYTTPEMTEWFGHIAAASEELREDFNRMAASGGTPRDFGHRVKSHPLMLVTSAVKMRSGTPIDITFEGDISETINFWRTKTRLERNWRAALSLVERAEADGSTPTPSYPRNTSTKLEKDSVGSWTWENVEAEAIIDFLSKYAEHNASKKVKTKLLAEYIQKEVTQGRLTRWSIFTASGDSGVKKRLGNAQVNLVRRSWHCLGSSLDRSKELQELRKQGHYRIRRLVSPLDETADLSAEEYNYALERTVADWEASGSARSKPSRPGGRQIREIRAPGKGLLLLYPLDPSEDEKVEAGAEDIPVLAFALSFPHVDPSNATKVRYIVNNVYWKQEFGPPLDNDGDA